MEGNTKITKDTMIKLKNPWIEAKNNDCFVIFVIFVLH